MSTIIPIHNRVNTLTTYLSTESKSDLLNEQLILSKCRSLTFINKYSNSLPYVCNFLRSLSTYDIIQIMNVQEYDINQSNNMGYVYDYEPIRSPNAPFIYLPTKVYGDDINDDYLWKGNMIAEVSWLCWSLLDPCAVSKTYYQDLSKLMMLSEIPMTIDWNLKHPLNSLFVLGKGYAEHVSKEIAKIISAKGVHAEGYSGGAFKHGPFALISKDTPIIALLFKDEHVKKMQTAIEEMKARGAKIYIITDDSNLAKGLTSNENVLQIPSCGKFTALLAIKPIETLCNSF